MKTEYPLNTVSSLSLQIVWPVAMITVFCYRRIRVPSDAQSFFFHCAFYSFEVESAVPPVGSSVCVGVGWWVRK